MYRQNPTYSDPITLGEVKEILEACGKELPFQIIEPALGAGDYGHAFLTDKGTVVKFTTQRLEIGLAMFVLKHPDAHPTLPKVYDLYTWDECHRYDDPLFVIHREALNDVPVANKEWLDDCVIDFEHYLGITKRDPIDIAVDILGKAPGDPDDELLFEKLAEFYIWAFAHGLTFNDTGIENWGIRDDGTLVIRDFGAFIPGSRNYTRYPGHLGQHKYF